MLYASHWVDPDDVPCPFASAPQPDDAKTSITGHRCMEQTCFAVGSCLMSPCDSLRPRPPLGVLPWSARGCEAALPGDSLVCSYFDVDNSRLSYEIFAPSTGVRDCWTGLEAAGPDAYVGLRVWEQVGFSDKPKELQERHREAVSRVLLVSP